MWRKKKLGVLGQVMKSLSTEWDKASVDKLMSLADASGDGELSVEEFVESVFADAGLLDSKEGRTRSLSLGI